MIDGDENANDKNSSDGEGDVGAGAGASDDFIKLKRCVFAAPFCVFGTGGIHWWLGMGLLMVRSRKTMWVFDPGAAVPGDLTLYHIVAILYVFLHVLTLAERLPHRSTGNLEGVFPCLLEASSSSSRTHQHELF